MLGSHFENIYEAWKSEQGMPFTWFNREIIGRIVEQYVNNISSITRNMLLGKSFEQTVDLFVDGYVRELNLPPYMLSTVPNGTKIGKVVIEDPRFDARGPMPLRQLKKVNMADFSYEGTRFGIRINPEENIVAVSLAAEGRKNAAQYQMTFPYRIDGITFGNLVSADPAIWAFQLWKMYGMFRADAIPKS